MRQVAEGHAKVVAVLSRVIEAAEVGVGGGVAAIKHAQLHGVMLLQRLAERDMQQRTFMGEIIRRLAVHPQ